MGSNRKMYSRILSVIAIAAIAGIALWLGLASTSGTRADPNLRLVFAEDSRNFWTAPTIIAKELGIFEKEGLDVELVDFPSGLACKNAVLSGSADIGIVGTTPVAIGGFQHENVVLIASYVKSNQVMKMVANGAGAKPSPDFLVGRRVGIVPGTSSEIVFDRLIEKYRLDSSKVLRATFRPAELIPALIRRDIDAFVCWEPLPLIACRGSGVATFCDPDLYTQTLYLVSRPDAVNSKRAALAKFLKAVDRAIVQIAEDPESARSLVEKRCGLNAGDLLQIWPTLAFSVQCRKGEITADLQSEGEWAKRSGVVKGALPTYERNVEDGLYAEFRREVRP